MVKRVHHLRYDLPLITTVVTSRCLSRAFRTSVQCSHCHRLTVPPFKSMASTQSMPDMLTEETPSWANGAFHRRWFFETTSMEDYPAITYYTVRLLVSFAASTPSLMPTGSVLGCIAFFSTLAYIFLSTSPASTYLPYPNLMPLPPGSQTISESIQDDALPSRPPNVKYTTVPGFFTQSGTETEDVGFDYRRSAKVCSVTAARQRVPL